MKIGVFGGTFDPIHLGHVALAERAQSELSLDRVIFVPAGKTEEKATRGTMDAAKRLEMIRLAIGGKSGFEISTIETDRKGISYTAETLAALAASYQGAKLFFILGEDTLEDFPRWHQPRRILELAQLAVARRTGAGTEAGVDWQMVAKVGRLQWIEMPLIQISSTEVRRLIASGEPVDALVPPLVAEYIRQQGLYMA